MITLYGIPNCDTIRKARRWLDERGIDYHFHDYRRDGLALEKLAAWADELGWENLINRRGTTWRQLPQAERDALYRHKALELMLAQPAIIKRPLLDVGTRRLLGFDEAHYNSLFQSNG